VPPYHIEFFRSVQGCSTTRRSALRGAPLSGVALDEGPPGEGPARVSDNFGRIFRFVGYGRSFSARRDKSGYASQTVMGDCPVGSKTVRDLTIVLRRSERGPR
jgi:hypothetical protein